MEKKEWKVEEEGEEGRQLWAGKLSIVTVLPLLINLTSLVLHS